MQTRKKVSRTSTRTLLGWEKCNSKVFKVMLLRMVLVLVPVLLILPTLLPSLTLLRHPIRQSQYACTAHLIDSPSIAIWCCRSREAKIICKSFCCRDKLVVRAISGMHISCCYSIVSCHGLSFCFFVFSSNFVQVFASVARIQSINTGYFLVAIGLM